MQKDEEFEKPEEKKQKDESKLESKKRDARFEDVITEDLDGARINSTIY